MTRRMAQTARVVRAVVMGVVMVKGVWQGVVGVRVKACGMGMGGKGSLIWRWATHTYTHIHTHERDRERDTNADTGTDTRSCARTCTCLHALSDGITINVGRMSRGVCMCVCVCVCVCVQVTYVPALEGLGKKLIAAKRDAEAKKSESVWEAYLRRRKEKRKERKNKKVCVCVCVALYTYVRACGHAKL